MRQHRVAAVLALWVLSMATFGGADPIPITGKVLDAQGRALPGARVELEPLGRSFERQRLALERRTAPEPVSAVSSDGSGFFSLAAPDVGMWTVRIKARGFAPRRLDLTPLLEALEMPPFELQPGLDTEVGVPDAPSKSARPRRIEVQDAEGRPVAGALVSSEDRTALGLTDARGFLSAAVVPGREPRLFAETADGRWGRGRLQPGTEPVRIKLAPTPDRLTGRVLDRLSGKPLAGAFVWPREDAGAAVRTDSAGVYHLLIPPREGLSAAAVRHLPAEAALRRQGASAKAGPDFILSPAAAVAGSVVDARGRPIERVELEAAPAGVRLPSAQIRTRSDARGRFTLGGLDPAKSWELRAVRRGFLPATLTMADLKPLSSRSDLRIVLQPGRPTFGTVVDEAGRPIVGAEVSLLPAEGTGESDFASHREIVARAASDPKGHFEFDMLPAARVDLEVRALGFVSTLVRGLAVASGEGAFDLGSVVLTSGEILEGRVEDPQGRPLDAASITVQRVDPTAVRLAWSGSPPQGGETVTRADGRFEVRGLRSGEPVDLLVKREGYAARTVTGFRPPLEEPVKVVLSPALRISGRILDEKGDPIAAAQAVLRRDDGIAGVGSTDGEGRFTLEAVPSGRLALDASAQGYLPVRMEKIEMADGVSLEGLEIVLPRGAALEGTVFTPDGSPAAGAMVSALPAPGGRMSALFVMPETRTESDGRYRLEGLPKGTHSISARHPAYQNAVRDLEIQEDETRLDLRLRAAWEIAGRTVDGSGQGIAGVRIEWIAPDGGGQEILSGAGGSFRFTGVGEGRHRLRAEKQGYAQLLVREVQIAGGPVRDLELRLERGSVLTGQILGLSFQDLARVQVAATRAGLSAEQSGRIDYQGRYRVDDLAPGDWIVLARLPDGRLAEGQVTVLTGARDAMLDLKFESGLSLSGRLLAGSAPVAGALIYLRSGDGSGGGGRSGPQGEFRIEGLKPGLYTLLVTAPEKGFRHQETLDLQADRQVVIELGAHQPAAPERGGIHQGRAIPFP